MAKKQFKLANAKGGIYCKDTGIEGKIEHLIPGKEKYAAKPKEIVKQVLYSSASTILFQSFVTLHDNLFSFISECFPENCGKQTAQEFLMLKNKEKHIFLLSLKS